MWGGRQRDALHVWKRALIARVSVPGRASIAARTVSANVANSSYVSTFDAEVRVEARVRRGAADGTDQLEWLARRERDPVGIGPPGPWLIE